MGFLGAGERPRVSRWGTGLRAMLSGCVEPQLTEQERVNIMPRAL
jgi:hypothetical protein